MADDYAGAADTARLAHLVRTLSLSASLQADRGTAEAEQAQAWRHEATLLRASLFWRLTGPLRLAVDIARGRAPLGLPWKYGLARARDIAARDGWRAAGRRARAWLRRHRPAKADLAPPPSAPPDAPPESPTVQPLSEPPGNTLAPNILIIAELTLPQCAKYRVWQKQEFFRILGIPCRVVNWHDAAACRAAASLATAAIFYRVPGFPAVLALIDECKRLQLPIWWEVDDLIFDEAEYLQNRNLAHLDDDLRQSILSGVPLYRSAMLACGRGIASTERLAQAMRDAGLRDVHIIENALDAQTLDAAERLRAPAPAAGDGVVITYGSGTRTHDADFAIAAPGLLAALHARPTLRLRIVGDLTLPPAFAALADRVEHVPKTHYASYLELLARSDISIAPLEDTIFNHAKSNIKFLEAAVLCVPSVCSPRATFASVITDGVNGLLAEGNGWESALLALADDADMRARLGEAARSTALARYAPEAVAQAQLAPLLAGLPERPPAALRVLAANVYFWPRSFGGATIVAEEMARRLHARGDTIVHIVTGADDRDPALYPGQALLRTEMPVPGRPAMMVLPMRLPGPDAILGFDNPRIGQTFGEVLDAVQPDVVHLHSLQGLSASIALACLERRIPYVVTLHDAWWLCARQFMVQGDGTYCFQTSIDIKVCDICVPGTLHLRRRYELLMEVLRGAALLLSPSEAHRRLYLAQGLPPAQILVAPNGVRHPSVPNAARPLTPGRLTFAYVGGNVDVKGYWLVKRVFQSLTRADWRLVMVDNTKNLGFSSIDVTEWKTRGAIETVPAYTQETMDAFFAGIDVLLFPSQWKESFGLTVREALLRGVWVIATSGGGPAEAISDGVNGTVIPLDGRPDRLRGAVEALLDDPGRLARAAPPAGIIDFATQAGQLYKLLVQTAAKGMHEAKMP
jgi:glycosyltransferase involved in cell wall biosynthesis